MRFVAAPSHFGARKSRTRSTGLAFYRAAPTTMASIARAVAAATASSAALVVTVQSVRRVSTPPIRPARSAEHARQAPLREFYGTAATSSRHPPHVCNAAGFNSRRLRSSQELVGDGDAEDDEDYDPYMHGGRPNRSAIKRLIDERQFDEARNLLREAERTLPPDRFEALEKVIGPQLPQASD